MLDVKEGVSEGKAMDMMQTAQLLGFDTKVVGCTNDYEKTANSDVVVITSGIPRKPGMTREELIGVNAGIVKSVAQNILKYSPNAILVVISNPMDTMTYLSLKSLGLPKNRIIGMGGRPRGILHGRQQHPRAGSGPHGPAPRRGAQCDPLQRAGHRLGRKAAHPAVGARPAPDEMYRIGVRFCQLGRYRPVALPAAEKIAKTLAAMCIFC